MLRVLQAILRTVACSVKYKFCLGVSAAMLLMLSFWLAVSAESTPLSKAGYLDFSYQGWSGAGAPTGEKQESKLWWNDGFWWGSLYNSATSQFHIYRLNWGTHTWEDTGVALDNRPDSKADVLWDGAANKLYVASHVAILSDGEGVDTEDHWGRFYRYSYDATHQTYTLDAGFPVTVNEDKTESLVLTKGASGRLWITYVSRGETLHPNADYRVFINSSGNDGASWGTPFVPTLTISDTAVHVNRGDISSIVAVDNMVGVMWNNSISVTNQTLHFAVHADNSTSGPWVHQQIPVPEGADDHISVKSLMATGDGKVFAAIKTDAITSDPLSETLPLVTMIGVDINTSTVISRPFSRNTDKDTRPMLLLDEGDLATKSDDKVYVFVTGKETGSKICYKALTIVTPISNMAQFPVQDCGTVFIEDSVYGFMNDSTSMKRPVNKTTGIVVLASDDVSAPGGPSRMYAHNEMGNPPPVMTSRYPLPAATGVAITSVVTATFSKPMVAATFDASTFSVQDSNGAGVAGSYSYDASSRTAIFVPDEPLLATATYTVKLTNGIRDLSNQLLNETIDAGPVIEEWSFTTAASVVQFSESLYSANEIDGAMVVSVTLSAPSAETVTVAVASSDGTATVGDGDYSAVSTNVVFNPGETVKSFSVPLNNDALQEGEETFVMTLSSPTNVLLGSQATATGVIIDDDVTSVQFQPSALTVSEADGQAALKVTLSKAAVFSITVNYATSDGSAVSSGALVDYSAASGTVTFNPGELSHTIVVPIADDGLHESTESFSVILSNVAPGSVALSTLNGTANVTVNDDDPAPVAGFSSDAYSVVENAGVADITVVLSNGSSSVVTVDYASANGVALAGSDYTTATGTLTFAPGEVSKSFSVTIVNDSLNELEEALTLRLRNPQNAALSPTSSVPLSILDDDAEPTVQFAAPAFTRGEGGGDAVIEVVLNGPAGRLVSVDYATSDGTGVEGEDYASAAGTLLFAPGETSQTFEISLLDDIFDEEDETVNIALSNPAEAALGGQSLATLTIDDNDPAFPRVGFTATEYTVTEGAEFANVDVVLNSDRKYAVSVQYIVTDGTATDGSDFTASSGVVTFAAGEVTKTLNIPVMDDSTLEEDETISLLLSNPVNGVLDARSAATLTIQDNEEVDEPIAPTVNFGDLNYTVSEDAGKALIEIKLSISSTISTSVQLGAQDDTATAEADYQFSAQTVVFAPGEVAKVVEISIVDDDKVEANETVSLLLTNSSNATLGAQSSALLTIVDNDVEGEAGQRTYLPLFMRD